jgi:futalosine hydrolase
MNHSNLLVVPTLLEIQPLINKLMLTPIKNNLYVFRDWHVLIAGAGVFPFTFRFTQFLSGLEKMPNYALLVGVAGSYNPQLIPGDLCLIHQETWGDCGAEDHDGSLITMSELTLWPENSKDQPESQIVSPVPSHMTYNYAKVNSITVNVAAGCSSSIENRIQQFNPDIENMEGASFFKICQLNNIPCDQIRAISNVVEPRNRKNWKLKEAVIALNDTIHDIISQP